MAKRYVSVNSVRRGLVCFVSYGGRNTIPGLFLYQRKRGTNGILVHHESNQARDLRPEIKYSIIVYCNGIIKIFIIDFYLRFYNKTKVIYDSLSIINYSSKLGHYNTCPITTHSSEKKIGVFI